MKLKIAPGDCVRAERSQCDICPVANAFARKLLGRRNYKFFALHDKRVVVGLSHGKMIACLIDGGVELARWRIPRSLSDVIEAYDDGNPFRVGTYELRRVKSPS